ncbi:hypothetical protein [Methyloceanibacter caenitepidi]|uniref:hypothetical protein n=1 Tax=Methyloceanibacter caenitepidi TaxID=1384459 RepID=UPI0005F0B004|nr:hypothetical protein [Methyloceanibacter caenitepidi]
MWRSVGIRIIGGLLLGALAPLAAQAEDAAPAPSEWTVTGGFYGWFPWVEGSTDANGEDFNIYATPIDLIENFDAPPIMVNFEASRGKFSFWGDALYAKFAFGGDFASEAQPIPVLSVGVSGQTETDYTLGVYQFGGFYQVADFVGQQGSTTLEVGAGMRFIQQEIRIKAKIDAAAQVRLGKLANTIERRIRKIENQEQRLQALAALNDVRRQDLDQKIIRAGDKGRERRVAQLEKRLKRVDDRGQALAALEAVEKFRLELLRAALRIDGKEFNNQFAFVGTGNLDWVDPTIALRLQHDFGNGHSVTATGDFGGYNVEEGLSSQIVLTYDIEGTLWGFDTTTSLGYKALWLSYEDETPRGDVGISAWLHGPIAEVALRW